VEKQHWQPVYMLPMEVFIIIEGLSDNSPVWWPCACASRFADAALPSLNHGACHHKWLWSRKRNYFQRA